MPELLNLLLQNASTDRKLAALPPEFWVQRQFEPPLFRKAAFQIHVWCLLEISTCARTHTHTHTIIDSYPSFILRILAWRRCVRGFCFWGSVILSGNLSLKGTENFFKCIYIFLCDAQHHVLWIFFYPSLHYNWICGIVNSTKLEREVLKQLKSFSGYIPLDVCLFGTQWIESLYLGELLWGMGWDSDPRENSEAEKSAGSPKSRGFPSRRERDIKNGSKTNSVNVSTHVQLHPLDSVHLRDTMG